MIRRVICNHISRLIELRNETLGSLAWYPSDSFGWARLNLTRKWIEYKIEFWQLMVR